MITVIIQLISYDCRDKAKTTVKDNSKTKINYIPRERDVEAVETIIYVFQDFCMHNSAFFERQ